MLLREKVVGTSTATCLWLSTARKARASPLLFTKANIAAHQTIHCQRLTHVAKYRINGLRLIRRGFKREAVAEQLILLTIVFKREALLAARCA
nr:hypothetical protein [Escherichia coli]